MRDLDKQDVLFFEADEIPAKRTANLNVSWTIQKDFFRVLFFAMGFSEDS
jgi:hypothetical protein